jgi:DNA modification methylase
MRMLYHGDTRDMAELEDESVQCVVTSPPYWGLRKYSGVEDLIWDSRNGCEHDWVDQTDKAEGYTSRKRWQHEQTRADNPGGWSTAIRQHGTCSLCGAWRGSFGLEPTPELYVQHTVEILREVWRVLRKDGVVFWNIGDSYNSVGGHSDGGGVTSLRQGRSNIAAQLQVKGQNAPGLKPKDLVLIPFRVALAAQADGWYVRSDIIWAKPNPMPESVRDRPTTSHEHILMLTKSGTAQYWTHRDGPGTRKRPKADWRWANRATGQEVAAEPVDWKVPIECVACEGTGCISVHLGLDVWQEDKCPECNGKGKVNRWKRVNLWRGHDYYWDAEAVRERAEYGRRNWNGDTHFKGGDLTRGHDGVTTGGDPSAGRNLRTVWEFATQPYPEAHFATFPEDLPERCIKAATPEVGCCSECGAPWERVTESHYYKPRGDSVVGGAKGFTGEMKHWEGRPVLNRQTETTGWQPTCECGADKVPSVVLDPFCGSGTTLLVGARLGRRSVGYELSGEYCELSVKRNRQAIFEFGA